MTMNPVEYRVQPFSFDYLNKNQQVSQTILQEVSRIATTLQNPDTDALHDRINYHELIKTNISFGHFFLLQNCDKNEYVGFLLCFDDLQTTTNTYKDENSLIKSKNSSFPISHCEQFLDHDVNFLQDLYNLGCFAYLFQIGILPEHQHKHCGEMLIDAFENYYQNESPNAAHILAGAIHEKQYSIFSLIQNRNKKNGAYIFLDHYLDSKVPTEHWFRVVKLVNPKAFARKINPDNLAKTFNTVIPIQLNQAVRMVNEIIKCMDAKILWSSFFNEHDLLRNRYGMNKDNHGFFESLGEASKEQYFEIIQKLKGITNYLYKKENHSEEIVSLTDFFKKNSREIFFFNDIEADHVLSGFNRPSSFNISNIEDMLPRFLRLKIIPPEEWPANKMAYEERQSFQKTLTEIVRYKMQCSEQEENQNSAEHVLEAKTGSKIIERWRHWRRVLLIDDSEEALLFKGEKLTVNATSNDELTPDTVKDVQQQYEALLRAIKGRNKFPDELYERWEKYIHLHWMHYQIDSLVLKNPDDYWWCHAMIPINYSGSKNVSGIMFTYRCKKLHLHEAEYHHRMGNLANVISSALSKNMLNILIKLQQKSTNEAANRYAIAAVMSRNLAHNYGSHILTRLDKPELLQSLMDNEFDATYTTEMARFIGNLRSRTNLLADMSTTEPASSFSMWLKMEVLKAFKSQSIIKKFITNSTLRYIEVTLRKNGNVWNGDIEVQIPNGELGVSAFCMILENIARNTAKYENIMGLETLEISVDIVNDDERGYQISIYDNIPRDLIRLKELVQRIKTQYIEKPAIDSGNNLREYGWGIMEMSAAASYLRKKVPGVTIGEYNLRQIPLLKPEAKLIPKDEDNDNNEQYTLAYTIYLKKPRNILLLIPDDNKIAPAIAQAARERSDTKIITQTDLTRNTKAIHTHAFAIHFNSQDRKAIEARKQFPLRWILLNTEQLRAKFWNFLTRKDTSDELMNWLWEIWLSGYSERKNLDKNKMRLCIPVWGDKYPTEYLERYLLFDDHGEWAIKAKINPDTLAFYEVHHSNDPLGVVLNNTESLSDVKREILRQELYEAAITNVIIIDERIQDAIVMKSKTDTEDWFNKLKRMNIFIPCPEYGEPDLQNGNQSEHLVQWLHKILKSRKVDFIVLHLGLLEAWVSPKISKIEEWIEHNIDDIDSRPEIIFMSGRGKPHQFPNRRGFQPFDSIARFVTSGMISKYHLVKVLFSSRTR